MSAEPAARATTGAATADHASAEAASRPRRKGSRWVTVATPNSASKNSPANASNIERGFMRCFLPQRRQISARDETTLLQRAQRRWLPLAAARGTLGNATASMSAATADRAGILTRLNSVG